MESLIEAEKEADGNASELARVYESVGEVLRDEPSLPNRVRAEVASCDERTPSSYTALARYTRHTERPVCSTTCGPTSGYLSPCCIPAESSESSV
jgi:hypothetical protein